MIKFWGILGASRHHNGSLKWATMGVFTWAISRHYGLGLPDTLHAMTSTAVVNHHQHTMGPWSHCPLLKNVRHHGPLCKEVGRHRVLSASVPAGEPRAAISVLLSGPLLLPGEGTSGLHWRCLHISPADTGTKSMWKEEAPAVCVFRHGYLKLEGWYIKLEKTYFICGITEFFSEQVGLFFTQCHKSTDF